MGVGVGFTRPVVAAHLLGQALPQRYPQEALRVLRPAQQPRQRVGGEVDDLDAQQAGQQQEVPGLVKQCVRRGYAVA